MAIIWGRYIDEPPYSKLDLAISAGFDPGEDYNQPAPAHLRPPAGVDALAVFAAQVEAARAHLDCGVEDCGNRRCDTCGDRMACTGPEPRACGVSCCDCPCDCTACLQARDDMRADLLHRIEGEGL